MNTISLQRLDSEKPAFDELTHMKRVMADYAENIPQDCSIVDSILAFQDEDGSFKLMDSWHIPGDVRVEFCYLPTYYATAALIRAYLQKKPNELNDRHRIEDALRKALQVCTQRDLKGHGYEELSGQIEALELLASAGLRKLLEQLPSLNTEFTLLIRSIMDEYAVRLKTNHTSDYWGTNYRADIEKLYRELEPSGKLYVAYGSNMDLVQMKNRCPGAKLTGPVWIDGYQLAFIYHATIELIEEQRTPALLWEITEADETALDRYEGFPSYYSKAEVPVVAGKHYAKAMAYVMTDYGKQQKADKGQLPGHDYLDKIAAAYKQNGFDKTQLPAGQPASRP